MSENKITSSSAAGTNIEPTLDKYCTDEDARQAMMMNGGKIKEVQVTLLLSSRAEMQKVIEEARRTTLSFMQLSTQNAPAVQQQQAPVVPKTTASVVSGSQQPQPPVISLSGFLAQNLNQQKNQSIYSEIPGLGFLATSGGMFQPNAPAAGLFSALSAQSYTAGGAANSAFTQLSEQLKKVGEAEKLATASTKAPALSSSNSTSLSKKESTDRTSRRSRSSSRERDRRRSSRDRSRERSRSRDRGSRRRGRDRSRSRDRRSRTRSRDRGRDRRRRSRSRDRRDDRTRDRSKDKDRDQKSASADKRKSSRFSDRGESKTSPIETIKIPSPKVTPTSFTSPWDTPIQQNLMKLANVGLDASAQKSVLPPILSPSQNMNLQDGMGGGDRNEQESKPAGPLQNPIMSYRMNVLPSVNYGSFQSSKPLSNEQLSKLQELQARRDPKLFQDVNMGGNKQGGHFSDGESNTFSRNSNRGGFDFPPTRRDGNENRSGDGYTTDGGGMSKRNQSMEGKSDKYDDIEGQSVKVSHLQNVTGYGEVRRFFHGQTISSNGIKMINDKNGRRTGVALIRFLRKDGKRYALSRDGMRLKGSIVKIESITDQEFDEAIDSYRPGYDEAPNNWREVNDEREEPKKDDVIEIRDDEQKEGKQGAVVVWNLPSMATELDLMRIFSDFTVVEVLIIKNYKNPKQLDGYVKFHRAHDARRACDSTHKHYIRNKRVFVKQCSEIEYDAAKNEYDAPQEQETVTLELDDSVQEVNDVSNDAKKNERQDDDDKMDLADEDTKEEDRPQMNTNEPAPQKSFENLFGSPPPSMPNNELQQSPSSMNYGQFSNQQFEGANTINSQDDNWESEQVKQPGPPLNRDPRNMYNQNFNQQYQQQPPMSQLNLSFGGDMNRDPRRRHDGMNQQQQFGFDQGNFQGDNSRDSFGSQHSMARFNPQGPPPKLDGNRFGGPQMGPMEGNNRYDQQQMGNNPNNSSFGNDRFDRPMGFNQGPPMGGDNRFDQQMNNNQGGPMGNNRFPQQQQQFDDVQGGQYGNSRFTQHPNRDNNRGNKNSDEKTTFIMITNLEYTMKEAMIFDFFDHEGFCPKHVHILRNRNGRSAGECLVEFESSQEAEETLSKSGQVIGKRKAFIKHLNRNQIMDVMQRINKQSGRGAQFSININFSGNDNFRPENNFERNNFRNGNNNFGGNSYDNDRNSRFQDNDNRFTNDDRNVDERNFQGSNYQTGPDEHYYGDGKEEDNTTMYHDENEDQHTYDKENEEPTEAEKDDLAENEHVDDAEKNHAIENTVHIDGGRDDDDPPLKQPNEEYIQQTHVDDYNDAELEEDDQHEESVMSNKVEGCSVAPQQQQKERSRNYHREQEPNQSGDNDDNHPNNREYDESDIQQPQHQQPEQMQGNILCLGNLPFRARNEELVGFFRDYNITMEDVKRRYLPDGRATGDAMVRFQSAMDAQRAMRTHQNRRVGGRMIRMRILDD